MKKIISFAVSLILFFANAAAEKYNYSFSNTPVSQAILKISKENPHLDINFIYNELNNYTTSAKIKTDNINEALNQIKGLNPISIVRKNNKFFIEALQHGKYKYTGKVVGTDNEPVIAATVMLLEPKDSTVLTYGFTAKSGDFSILCDYNEVIAKVTSLGYKPSYKRCNNFHVGTIVMNELPITLNNINIEAENAFLYPDKSVYLPTNRQKNSSQTAIELLHRMAIPQLSMELDKVETNDGKTVAIYIDYRKAESQDLTGMRTQDVRRVEYYDFPTDPRFQGHSHVINFIMTQYEYGGYAKIYGNEKFIHNEGNFSGYLKFQYKRMTYDLSLGNSYSNTSHTGSSINEYFRLPQENGEIKEFERISSNTDAKLKSENYWATFRAVYKNDNVTISNTLSGNFVKTPENNERGVVTYIPTDYHESPYSISKNSNVNSLTYRGDWYFIINDRNSLNISPFYSYSHTNQNSNYTQPGYQAYPNTASDDSNQGGIDAIYSHIFAPGHTLNVNLPLSITSNVTYYAGTADYKGDSKMYQFYPGISYGLNKRKIYLNTNAGVSWYHTNFNGIKESTFYPLINLYFTYSFSKRSSLNIRLNFSKWNPSASYRSDVIIRENPLMSYTGNPYLVPFNSWQPGISYTIIPNKKFRFSIYYNGWIVDKRYVYDYEATSDGIIRTIKQPLGKYINYNPGLSISTSLLNDNLQLVGSLRYYITHNGAPYNWTKSYPAFALYVDYYIKDFYIGGIYMSKNEWSDGCMNGLWIKSHSNYYLQAGWANANWNIKVSLNNFARWNWEGSVAELKSQWYDYFQQRYDTFFHASLNLSATYTFGFGKKVKRGDEINKQTGISSGILNK